MLDALIESLAAAPAAIARAASLFPSAARQWKPLDWEGSPGEHFSAVGQVCHLRDIETLGYHERIRRFRAEVNPAFPSLDGYVLEAERRYDTAGLEEAIQQFGTARETTVGLLRELRVEELARTATFENATITLRGLLHLLCSHDAQHLATLHWLLARAEAGSI